jgi:hypothetical protein
MCERIGVHTGDRVDLSLRLASDELPDELATLLEDSRRAKAAWAKLTPAQQRMLREEIFAANPPTLAGGGRSERSLYLEREADSASRYE